MTNHLRRLNPLFPPKSDSSDSSPPVAETSSPVAEVGSAEPEIVTTNTKKDLTYNPETGGFSESSDDDIACDPER